MLVNERNSKNIAKCNFIRQRMYVAVNEKNNKKTKAAI